jgi:hypothetical protein
MASDHIPLAKTLQGYIFVLVTAILTKTILEQWQVSQSQACT